MTSGDSQMNAARVLLATDVNFGEVPKSGGFSGSYNVSTTVIDQSPAGVVEFVRILSQLRSVVHFGAPACRWSKLKVAAVAAAVESAGSAGYYSTYSGRSAYGLCNGGTRRR